MLASVDLRSVHTMRTQKQILPLMLSIDWRKCYSTHPVAMSLSRLLGVNRSSQE